MRANTIIANTIRANRISSVSIGGGFKKKHIEPSGDSLVLGIGVLGVNVLGA